MGPALGPNVVYYWCMTPQPRTALLQVRMVPEEMQALEAFVRRMNEEAFEKGFPPTVTMSSVIRMWVRERTGMMAEPPKEEASPSLRPAPNVIAAAEKLRGAR